MIQLVFDLILWIAAGALLIWCNAMSKEISRLKVKTMIPGVSDQELEHVRRLEIAAGLREPDPEVPVVERPKPKVIKCACGHGVNMHRAQRNGRCTVAITRDTVCACEWGQPEVTAWSKGEME